jgi:hypothetical protein
VVNFVRHVGQAPQAIAAAFEVDVEKMAGALEETFDVFRHQAVFTGAPILAQDALQVNVACRQTFQGGFPGSVHGLLVGQGFDLGNDVLQRAPVGNGFDDELLEAAARDDFADDIKNAVTSQCGLNLLKLVEERRQHLAFAGIGGDQVVDMHLFLLTIAVDAPHALFETVRIPGDVVV